MEWMIASDSSCEIRTLPDTAPGVQFALVPFKIRVGEREFVDLPTLNTKAMLQAMTDYNGASATACPSPEEWAELFLMADKSIALTISHNLSGSYNAALAAREMVLEEHPEKQIFVLDTLSCSGALAGAAELANKLIRIGTNFDTICIELANCTEDGTIDFFFKTRGEARVLAKILEQMDEDGYDGVRPVLISECNNQNAANLLEHGIHAKWPDARVDIVPCSGLCSFYAQDQGVIITY